MVKSYSTKGPPPINQLSNVVLTDLADEEVLKYDAASGVWQNGTAGGGGGDPYFFKAVIPAGQTIRRSGGFGTINLVSSGFRAPYNTSDSDLAGNIWTCPSDGVYRIILRLVVRSTDDNIRLASIGLIDDPTFVTPSGLPSTKAIRYEQFTYTGLNNNGTQDAVLSWTWIINDLVELVAGQTIQVIARIYVTNSIASTTADWTGGNGRTATSGNNDGYGGLGHLTIEKVA